VRRGRVSRTKTHMRGSHRQAWGRANTKVVASESTCLHLCHQVDVSSYPRKPRVGQRRGGCVKENATAGKKLPELLSLGHLQRSQSTLFSAVANVAVWDTTVLTTFREVVQLGVWVPTSSSPIAKCWEEFLVVAAFRRNRWHSKGKTPAVAL
jgi:hypothetical protein